MREREMTRSMRNRGRTLRGIALFSLLLIPALLVGCKNKGSDGSKGPSGGATITGTAQNGVFRLSVNINPNTIPPGGSAGITVLATTLNGAPLDNRPVQMATSGGTLNPVAGKTDSAGKFVTSISIEDTFAGGPSVEVSAIVDGLTAKATLFINVPGTLSIDPKGPLFLAPGDTQFLNCVGGVDPVRWEPSGGTLNRLNERSVIFTAGSLTGIFFVKCTDAANNSASVEINIGTAQTLLTIAPTSVSLRPGQTQIFQATGGRPPYTWSFPATAGTLSTTTGPTTTLTAGTTEGTFTLLLTDSVGATKSAAVNIRVEALTLSPDKVDAVQTASGTIAAPGTCTFSFTVQFTATGGVPTYTFSNAIAQIGTINPTTGLYTVGPITVGVSKFNDVVTVRDSIGQQKSATVNFECKAPAI